MLRGPQSRIIAVGNDDDVLCLSMLEAEGPSPEETQLPGE